MATMVLSTMFGPETENEEPRVLNSNLLPVKANGLVLLRSVVSFANEGRTWTPSSMLALEAPSALLPAAMDSMISVSSSPRNMDTIAGGASLAPSLWGIL